LKGIYANPGFENIAYHANHVKENGAHHAGNS
jgi:hypothetical protein